MQLPTGLFRQITKKVEIMRVHLGSRKHGKGVALPTKSQWVGATDGLLSDNQIPANQAGDQRRHVRPLDGKTPPDLALCNMRLRFKNYQNRSVRRSQTQFGQPLSKVSHHHVRSSSQVVANQGVEFVRSRHGQSVSLHRAGVHRAADRIGRS